jgi:hypothetical protein
MVAPALVRILARLTTLLIVLVSLGLIVLAQEINNRTYLSLYDNVRKERAYIASSDALSFASFGHRSTMADLQWISMIQFAGRNVLTEAFEPELPKFIDVITTLDPRFSSAYEFALLMIRREDKEEARRLGERGITQLCVAQKVQDVMTTPIANLAQQAYQQQFSQDDICYGNYDLPYLLGFIEYEFFGNYERAARYYFISWHTKGSLASARSLTALMLSQAKHREIAVTMWMDLAEHAESEERRLYAEQKLQRELNFITIEEGIEKYVALYGQPPTPLTLLISEGFVEKQFFEDPFSNEKVTFGYVWDPERQLVHEKRVK